ncbi:MAG: ATP-dependent DNA helicase RecG [Anaerovoracaceae bacterium]|nr:ATP-dependent DNA helicase RecG [Anaerovoracaceae bacterium]
MISLTDDITVLKGVGTKKAEKLAKLGVRTVGDILFLFPRDYEDRSVPVAISELVPGSGSGTLVQGRVISKYKSPYRRGRQISRATITDGQGFLDVVYFNAPYALNGLRTDRDQFFFGRVTENQGRLQMIHPQFADGIEGIVPVYPLTKGITQMELRRYAKTAIQLMTQTDDLVQDRMFGDYMPQRIISEKKLCSLAEALKNIHFPDDQEALNEARKRIIYDELFIMQLGLLMMKRGKSTGAAHTADEKPFTDSLPYPLTNAQARAVSEICRDLSDEMAMNRLLQGDVGSGKTAVAEIAMYKVVMSGSQAAFMAPTDLLMKQHYETFKRDFEPFGIKVGYLSGHMKAQEKKQILEGMAAGEIDIVVGTHALIQEGVSFADLGLVITDEQHRFGVNQRMSFSEKGNEPDILVMTATPIPRTLAVIFYGDLDVSVIDELPPGRQEIVTRYYGSERRNAIYHRLVSQLEAGHQAYVVCPLIEDSDMIEARSAVSVCDELKRLYKNVRIMNGDEPGGRQINVELLHGEMKQDEKDEIMTRFAAGKIDVLVSTVVIEVGIDVPNATVMIIENAERFGLAQLHQLRGRVGRGKDQSYCMLILGSQGKIALERAKVLAESSDGFYISERDLDLRGPGEVFGTRQHGIPDTHLADMISHIDIMEEMRGYAMDVLEEDRELAKPENRKLKERVNMLFSENVTMNL